MSIHTTPNRERHSISFSLLYHGVLASLLSGLVFSIAASLAALASGKGWAAPVRLVAAVALGAEVLDPRYPLLSPFMWGMFLHLLYTVITAILFAWLITAVPRLRASASATFGAALLFAFLMWVSGFYLIAPLLGWNWFVARTDFGIQFVLQVIIWGGSLGVYFAQPAVRAQLSSDKATSTG